MIRNGHAPAVRHHLRSSRPAGLLVGATKTCALGSLAALMAIAGCRNDGGAKNGTAESPDVVARLGDEIITVADVENELSLRLERGALLPELDLLVDDMIERRLLVAKAVSEGLDQDPDLRRSWENLLIGRYKEIHLREQLKGLEVSPDEVEARYEAETGRFTRPAKARLAILTLPFTSVMTEEERRAVVDRMAEGRARALSAESGGLGFGALAVNYSEDQVTRHRGGDTGWLDEGVEYRWPAEVVAAGFALQPGATSEPIVREEGVYLVQKLDERPASSIPLEQVRDQIRKELHTTRIRDEEAAFGSSLRAGIEIETFPDALAAVRIPPQAKTRPSPEEQAPPDVP